MKPPLQIPGSDIGPLSFLRALAPHKKQWLQCIQTPVIFSEFELLYSHFIKTWDHIKSAFDTKNVQALKDMQSYLAPWPPVVMLALEPQHSCLVHAAWQTLLEFHTAARLALEETGLAEYPEWKRWRLALHERKWVDSFSSPCSTDTPGVLRTENTVSIVTTQPFSFVHVHSLQKIQAAHSNASSFRFQSPACCAFDTAYRLAAEDLFGAHSHREISKLAFWTMVGVQKESDATLALAWRPRYYGGPPGTPSWALHDAAATSGQAAAKARSAMLDWMTALSDSLHEQLHQRSNINWNASHHDFLQAYSRSWYAVARIGVAHKRTAAQVNNLLGCTIGIQKKLARIEHPIAFELERVLNWSTRKLQQTTIRKLELV